jgi:hypothetical protein
MKNLLLAALVAMAAYAGYVRIQAADAPLPRTASSSTQVLGRQADHTQVQGQGVVTRILADDGEGGRHQRFILQLGSGQTVLVAHNIDLAPRIDDLHTGDTVGFDGEYIWNPKGGVVHWTHHDPSGQHPAGWLKHGGTVYR